MAEQPPYNTRVYKTLQHYLGDTFKKSEEEFYGKLTSDPDYAYRVYKTLDYHLGDSFKRTEEGFYNAVGIKKKEELPSGDGKSSTAVVDKMAQQVEESGGKPTLEELRERPPIEKDVAPQMAASSTRVDESYIKRAGPVDVEPVDVQSLINIQKKKLNSRVESLRETLEHAQKPVAFGQTGSNVAGYELADEMSAQYRAAPEVVQRDRRKLQSYSEMQGMLKQAEKLAVEYDGNSWKALRESLASPKADNYLTLGLTEIMDNIDVAKARNKEPDNRTDEEQAWIDTYDILQQAQSVDKPLTYQVGRGVVEAVPFMVQFALSGGTATSVKKGINQVFQHQLKKQSKTKAAKYLASQGLPLSGKAVQTASKGAAYMAGRGVQTAAVPFTYQEISSRAASGESLPAAVAKGYASSLAELSSEGIFGAPVSKQASTLVKSGGMHQMMDRLRRAAKISTGGRQFAEEEIATTAQAVIDNDYESLEDFKTHATIFLTTQAISGGFSTVQGVASAYDAFESKRKENAIKQVEKDLSEIDKKVSGVKEGLDEVAELPFDQQAEAIAKIRENYELTSDEEVAALEYLAIKNKQTMSNAVKDNKNRQEKLLSNEAEVVEKGEIDNHDVSVLNNVDQELEKTDHELNKKIDAIDPNLNNTIKELKEEKVSLQERQNRVDTEAEKQEAQSKEKEVGDKLLESLKKRQKIRSDVINKSLEEVQIETGQETPVEETVEETVEESPEVQQGQQVEAVDTDAPPVDKEAQGVDVAESQDAAQEEMIISEPIPTKKPTRAILKTSDQAVTHKVTIGDNEVAEVVRDGWQIKNVEVEDDFQRQGIATKVYQSLNEQAKEQGETLRSDKPNKMSTKSKALWDSLVKKGEAEKLEDGSYQFKKPEYVQQETSQEEFTEEATEQQEQDIGQEETVEEEAPEQEQVDVAFNFLGERRFGKVVEETSDELKVEDTYGKTHRLPKNKQSPTYSNISTEGVAEEFQSSKENAWKEQYKQKLIQRKIDEGPTSSGVKVNFKKKGGNFIKLFDVYQGIPKEFYKANMRVTGKVNRSLDELTTFISRFDKKAKDAYGKYGDKQREEIQTVLEKMGTEPTKQIEALKKAGIPEPLHSDIIQMRNDIDALSKKIMEAGMLSDDLEVKFSDNRGMYLTRTYKRGKDKNWTWENIDDNIKIEAANVLHEYFPDKSDGWIEGTLKSMLTDTEISSLIGSSIGKVKKDILKKRSDFLTDHFAIRQFLGEYRNPAYNYAVSIAKMTEMLERQKMLDSMKDIGLQNGWLQEEKSDTHYKRLGESGATKVFYQTRKTEDGGEEKSVAVRSPDSRGYKPISEYYTTPEIFKAFEEFNKYSKAGAGMLGSGSFEKFYEKFVTNAKLSKTAYSIKSNVRNFLSNPINALANGNWNFAEIVDEYKRYSDGDGIGKFFSNTRGHELRLKMIEFGIVGDNVIVGQIKDNMRKLRGWNHQLEAGTMSVRDFFLKTYAFGDDFWKVTRFLSESGKYRKVYLKQGMSKDAAHEAATDKAIDIVHRTSAFYSMQPKMLQWMRKFPLTGTFVSFPYLTMQNFYNTNKIALQEIKGKGTAHIGIQRMLGAYAAFGSVATAGLLANRALGFDEEDVDDLRKFLPHFWQNDIVSFNRNNDGTFQYRNWSYLDYYTSVTQPTIMLGRKAFVNGEITNKDIVDAVGAFFDPYLSADMVASKVAELMVNSEKSTGNKIMHDGTEFADAFWHMADAVMPATITDIQRYFKAKRRGAENADDILVGMFTGNQVRNMDIQESLDRYILPGIEDNINSARYRYFKKPQYEGRSKQQIEAGRQEAENKINEYVTHMRDLYMSALRQGQDEREIQKVFKDNLHNKIAKAVSRGEAIRLTKDGDFE